jgi:hypothetical protein
MRIVRAVPDPPAPPSRDGWPPLCVLPLEPEDVPGAEWEAYVEEGLGDCRAACVEVEGGWRYGMVRHDDGPPGLQVFAMTAEERLPEAFAALLAAAGLTAADLPWTAPDLGCAAVDTFTSPERQAGGFNRSSNGYTR